jgi:Asp-tRNA(Asn)/Glu-tRNA(Gln) amidotransferase A subunit family amidase
MTTRRDFLATTAGSIASSAFGQTQDLTALSMKKAADLVRSKAASPTELTQACLKRIQKYDRSINAFITITGEGALAEARTLSAEASVLALIYAYEQGTQWHLRRPPLRA